MSCEYPVICPECGGRGQVPDNPPSWLGGAIWLIECPTCSGDGEVCPAKRDAYRAEHGPDC